VALQGKPIFCSLVVLKSRYQSVQKKGVDADVSHAALVRYNADTVDPDPLVVSNNGMPRFVVSG